VRRRRARTSLRRHSIGKAVFAESDATVVDRLAESNGRLREAAVAAKDNGPAAAEEDLIRRFIDSCDSFDATLRKHSPARTT
jgi:hypothetical protein